MNTSNCTYKTITKFLSCNNDKTEYDIIFIDECSTVSNTDMFEFLKKATFKLLILVGDIYQIESILFGNWFHLAKSLVSRSAVFELNKPYRSSVPTLINLWNAVRNFEDSILEIIAKNQISTKLYQSIFEKSFEDEIILCLNYNGLYGINNINRFLQSNNKNSKVLWGTNVFKIDDPIIFNESARFSPIIYNNLKGKIVNISKNIDKIVFDVEIDKVINELDALDYDFELMPNASNGNSVIRFKVDKHITSDNDEHDSSSIIPFQVAYAISMHKAQGLEYSSVKIVITDEIEEMITHNIFYTAITRAKQKLKIYWSPETENRILSNFTDRFNKRDLSILKSRFNL